MPRKLTRKSLVKKLDKVFSEYIRKRHADKNGIAVCYTCFKKAHWKELQCGHFVSRKQYATRWDETNCQVQCSGCNVFRYGEQYKFGRYLDSNFGDGTADTLFQKGREIVKFANIDLEEMIEYYQEKLVELNIK